MKVRKYKQDPPNAIQIELTEGCQLACSFCGMQGIRNNGANGPKNIRGKNSKPYKYLKRGRAFIIAHQIAYEIAYNLWNPRIEFAMHGEPTLNPFCVKIVSIFREMLPRLPLMMTSNGGGFLKNTSSRIDKLMDVGLNVLLLDSYGELKIVDKIVNKYSGKYNIRFYPDDKKANPHIRRKVSEKLIVVAEDPSIATTGTHSFINNHAGCAFPPNDNLQGKRCAKPFREISIRWDGNITICCNDFRGYYKCGNILDGDLNSIWQNEYFNAARKKLYHGERSFGPCNGCDAYSYRTGLLPDRLGKKSLLRVSESDSEAIKKALSGKSYTKPIMRPWESESGIRREPVIV